MFFKIGVHKIFENFTGKHLCWSLFLTNFIKNKLQLNTSFSRKIFEIFMNTFLQNTAGGYFCILRKDFVDIGYENSHAHTRRLCVAAANLFLKIQFHLWFVECLFLIVGTDRFPSDVEFTPCFPYRLNPPLYKIHGIA